MAIHQLLREAVFLPEDIARMTAAYEAALQSPRLTDRSDPVTDILAKKIIEVMRSGEADPSRISTRAIQELGIVLSD